MPTNKVKKGVYIDSDLERKLQDWMSQNRVFSHSKAIGIILEEFLSQWEERSKNKQQD